MFEDALQNWWMAISADCDGTRHRSPVSALAVVVGGATMQALLTVAARSGL